MIAHRALRPCSNPECSRETRARSGLCPSHRPAVTATWHRGTLRILGHHLTPQQAYQLAEAIADALADAPTVVLSTTVALDSTTRTKE